jgi:hypothetical protein
MGSGRLRYSDLRFRARLQAGGRSFPDQVPPGIDRLPPKIAILVSNYDHGLADLLYRHSTGELACEIVTIISNHPTAKRLTDFYHVPFHHLSNSKDKRESEREMLELLGQDVDLIVLARYMQILGPDFVAQYLLRMINIHHSFLPAFVGAKPYHQAYERGVKRIGGHQPLRDCRTRRRPDHRARRGPRFPSGHGRQHGEQRPRLGESGALARRTVAPGKPRAGLPEQDSRVRLGS